MTKRAPKDVEAATLLEQILGDAQGDDAQLWALVDAIAAGAKMPADAFVVGEPVQVTAVSYEGNPRVGLLATCRRGDERHVVSLADVVFSPGNDWARFSAAYRTWLRLAPHSVVEQGPTRPRKRHKAEAADIDLARPLK